jgi:hypothetical protein
MNHVMTISIRLNTLALSMKLSFFVAAVSILLVHYTLFVNEKVNFKHTINMSEISMYEISQAFSIMYS